ncbi:fasciclin domain-containing protein [Nonlabens sp. Ci31]|nr:fasciclin domain-containing protein [Nonlabens sp. Ci31]
MAEKKADSLKMVEDEKVKRDAMAININGAMMYPDMTIVENASTSKDLSTLVAAVKAAGLVETLNSEGPFTVFAPTNDAFSALPEGTVETLLKPENKATLSSILKYHVVSGNIMAGDLLKMIEEGKGKTTFATVNGATLTAMVVDGKVMIKDATGATATVAIADVKQSNGVVHVIDKVLLPSK